MTELTQTQIHVDARQMLPRIEQSINAVVLGKARAVRLALACLLARGHLLIEDVPGVGKTTLAQTLARVLGLVTARIQFTSDLLPADIIGVSVFDPARQTFQFHPGPLFASLVLADEINRASPKAQSALLEAMEEGRVTVDGTSHVLPVPFFVIATQNPRNQAGTFALPESQLDRFLMRIRLGYPDHNAEQALLKGQDSRQRLALLEPVAGSGELAALQDSARAVRYADALVAYVQALLAATRESERLDHGLSPRAGLALLHAAQAWALLEGRSLVLPEDVQAVAPAVIPHRLALRPMTGADADQLVAHLLNTVPVP